MAQVRQSHHHSTSIKSNSESPRGNEATDSETQLSENPSPPRPRYVRSVKKFTNIVSPMDPADRRSGIHMSEFRGMYNLAMIAGALYTMTTSLSNLLSRGDLYDAKLLLSVFYSWHFLEVLVTFACQTLYSYTALIPVYMAGTQWFSGRLMINIAHHFFQSVLFVFTGVFIIYRDWNTIHAVSAFVECLVLLMKMHSYIRTKLELARNEETVPTANVRDFTLYLFYPTLVYEPKYPRTEKIRWGYVAEKFIANALAMSMLYIIVTDQVMPRLEDSALANPVLVVINLLLPFLGCYLMIWFIIFECICNGFAELTYLADRDFYGDWWNSTTFDEFARKWNKPVHEFLLRHVYLESLETYKLSRHSATMLTFFVSAALHECVFVIVFRTVKMYFFVLQMLQLVIIMYGRGMKGTRVGNYFFWFGMILGPPLQAVIYCREYHGGEPIFMNLMVPIMAAGFGSGVVGSVMYMRAHGKKQKAQ
ncbi:Sterol o-acyltransferase, partial [Globisporangium splendens]